MLKDIITSRVRVKVLQLFLQKIDALYHVREIVRKTSEEINAVRRELIHLEQCGLLSKENRGNRVYYSFRKNYPLYFEFLEIPKIIFAFGFCSAIILLTLSTSNMLKFLPPAILNKIF